MGRVKIYQETIAGGMPSGGMLLAGGMKPGPELAKALGEARRRALLGEDAQEAVKAVLAAENLNKGDMRVEGPETSGSRQGLGWSPSVP
ncbi:MAG: hypothetical protein ACLUHE_15600 [Christensenellales bacterium]